MKKQDLQKLIREEVAKVMKEADESPASNLLSLLAGPEIKQYMDKLSDTISDQDFMAVKGLYNKLYAELKKHEAIEEGQELTEGNIMIFSYAKPYINSDASEIRAEVDNYIEFLQSKNINVHTGSDALYFPNFTFAGGKQQLGECIGVLAGSDTIILSPIGENKTYKFGESLLARFVKDGRIPAFLIKGSMEEGLDSKPIKSFKVTELSKIFAKIGFPTTKVEVYDNANAGPTLSIEFKNTLADENEFIDAYTDFQFDNGALGSMLPDIKSAYHKGGNKWEFQMQK